MRRRAPLSAKVPLPGFGALALVMALAMVVAACGGNDEDDGGDTAFVGDIRQAVEAVEAELGAGQEYFEVTATPQLTNVFVAVDDATTAVPYLFLDGELQEPAPALEGASGFTFTADQIAFDDATVLSRIAAEVPEATVESLSVEGGADGSVRYVASVRAEAGGLLDVTVAADGAVLAVDPI